VLLAKGLFSLRCVVAAGRPFQLQADQFGAGAVVVVAVLLEPVRQDQARRVVVGLVLARIQQRHQLGARLG